MGQGETRALPSSVLKAGGRGAQQIWLPLSFGDIEQREPRGLQQTPAPREMRTD